MKKGYLKSSIILVLALSIIIAFAIGIPMLQGFAEGVSGNPNPTIGSTVTSLTGNSLRATSYSSNYGVSSMGYPRLITNGNQISATIWAYDTAGITNLEVRFIKNNSTDPASTWSPYSNVDEIYYNNFSPYSNSDDIQLTFTLTPGKYTLMSRAITPDGRSTLKFNYIEYGTGNIIGTDFYTAPRTTSTGWEKYCAIYDLSGTGINIPGCSLLMTRVGHNPPFNYVSTDLRITQDAQYTKRYQVVGTVDPNAFSFMRGTYRTWLNVQRSNGAYETINYPDQIF